ncbi:MAG: permease of the major facilitator superfamily, partial [Microbacterium sp.]|nr:permease of the major facilitator superfamily [Microbacterium sp.]
GAVDHRCGELRRGGHHLAGRRAAVRRRGDHRHHHGIRHGGLRGHRRARALAARASPHGRAPRALRVGAKAP